MGKKKCSLNESGRGASGGKGSKKMIGLGGGLKGFIKKRSWGLKKKKKKKKKKKLDALKTKRNSWSWGGRGVGENPGKNEGLGGNTKRWEGC